MAARAARRADGIGLIMSHYALVQDYAERCPEAQRTGNSMEQSLKKVYTALLVTLTTCS